MGDGINLICIPHAGGSAVVYMKWKKFLNNNVRLHPIELSGRGSRYLEPFYITIEDAALDVFEHIEKLIVKGNYVLCGHSMGCTLVYEVMKIIIKKGYGLPKHVIFSGCKGIGYKVGMMPLHNADITIFKDTIIKYGGTSEVIFDNSELADFFIPIMRADLKILEMYTNKTPDVKMPVDISVFAGIDDFILSKSEKETWNNITVGKCHFSSFKGGHFYLFNESINDVVETINNICLNL